MVDELAENRSIMENDVITGVVASGNAVQKNSVLQQVIADAFQAEVQIPAESEEAAYGAALFGAVNAGAITRTQGKEMIRYKNEKEEERGYESEQGDYIIGLSLWLTMSVRMRTGLTGRTVWMVQFTQREERSIPSLR
ncbi:MAG: hypothetical protein J6B85_13870 [Lachnospiraceae bacterium]|nr:hypothetical protein [Lachnospiraceae bacterium]